MPKTRRRRDEEFASRLPTFKTEPVSRGLGVECQRTGCGGKFVVNEKRWRESSDAIARPCPYCFAVSKIPTKGA